MSCDKLRLPASSRARAHTHTHTHTHIQRKNIVGASEKEQIKMRQLAAGVMAENEKPGGVGGWLVKGKRERAT